jgi:hypothetical protein
MTSSIANLVWSLGSWNWLILAAILALLEVMAPGMHIVWFALAAGIVGLLALVVPMTWQAQVLLFLALAAAAVILARRLVRNDASTTDQPHLNVRAAQYIGQTFEVAEAIAGDRGRIKVGDSLWQARGPDAATGSRVKVVGADGTVLLVEPTAR